MAETTKYQITIDNALTKGLGQVDGSLFARSDVNRGQTPNSSQRTSGRSGLPRSV
jgi:hypothetical protein